MHGIYIPCQIINDLLHYTHNLITLTKEVIMRVIQNEKNIPKQELTNIFKNYLNAMDLSKQTIKSYIHDVNHFLSWLDTVITTDYEIKNITEFDLSSYRNYMLNVKHLKSTTINRRIQSLKKYFMWLTERGFIHKNIANHIRIIKLDIPKRPNALNHREIHSLLSTVGRSPHGLAKRNMAIIQLMLGAGLRVGEVRTLILKDIIINNRSGSITIRQGKGLKERTVPLNATVRKAVNEYLVIRKEEKPPENQYIFQSKRNTPLSLRSIQEMVLNMGRRAGITRIKLTSHILRHTFASKYLKANPGMIVELATLLGHASLNTTAIYTKPSQDELADSLEKLSSNICGNEK